MPYDERDVEAILSAILNYKVSSQRRPTWVNAGEIAQHIGLPVPRVAEVLCGLEIEGFLELAPRMYGSSSDPKKQKYGLTTEGARRAREFDSMKFDYTKMRGDILVTMRFALIQENELAMSPQKLAQRFHEDAHEIVQILRSLEADGYIKFFSDMGKPEEEMLYQLTQQGHGVADYFYREGRFPPPSGMGGSTVNNSIVNHGQMGAAVQGNANTVSVTYAPGIDGAAFTDAVKAFEAALRSIGDVEEREVGELRLNQLRRTVEAGQPSQSQWDKLCSWVRGTSEIVTGGVVLWNAVAAIGAALGHPLPAAPQGLGQ